MSNKPSLKKTFIQKYGQDIIFSEKDKREVLTNLHGKTRRPKWKWNIVLLMATAPVLALILTLSIQDFGQKIEKQPQSAELKSPPESDSSFFGDEGIQRVKKEGKFQQINQTVEDNGIAVTLHEVMYDGARIAIVYSLDTEKDLQTPSKVFPFEKIFINGKRFMNYSVSGGFTNEEDKYIIEHHLTEELPDEFQMDYEMISIGDQKGQWNFSIPIKKTEGGYKYVKSDSSEASGDLFLELEEATFAPSAAKFKIHLSEPAENAMSRDPFNRYVFEIKDEKGNALTEISAETITGEESEGTYTGIFHKYYEPVKDIPETITIQPYLLQSNYKEEIKEPLQQELPIYLEQDEYGGISITKVERYQGEIWVHYKTKGLSAMSRVHLMLKEKASNSEIERYDGYNKHAGEYIAKFKTSLPLEDLVVSTNENIVTEIDGLQLKADVK